MSMDLTGQQFGRLTVLQRAEKDKWGGQLWHCRCGCGQTSQVRASNLRAGTTTSCGCVAKEVKRQRASQHGPGHPSFLHGMSHTPEHKAYCSASERCLDVKNKDYPNYGGRGIDFRFDSFAQFFAELGVKPEPKRRYSLDRKNTNGHYEPGNVRWATYEQQNANRRPFKRGPNKLKEFGVMLDSGPKARP